LLSVKLYTFFNHFLDLYQTQRQQAEGIDLGWLEKTGEWHLNQVERFNLFYVAA